MKTAIFCIFTLLGYSAAAYLDEQPELCITDSECEFDPRDCRPDETLPPCDGSAKPVSLHIVVRG